MADEEKDREAAGSGTKGATAIPARTRKPEIVVTKPIEIPDSESEEEKGKREGKPRNPFARGGLSRTPTEQAAAATPLKLNDTKKRLFDEIVSPNSEELYRDVIPDDKRRKGTVEEMKGDEKGFDDALDAVTETVGLLDGLQKKHSNTQSDIKGNIANLVARTKALLQEYGKIKRESVERRQAIKLGAQKRNALREKVNERDEEIDRLKEEMEKEKARREEVASKYEERIAELLEKMERLENSPEQARAVKEAKEKQAAEAIERSLGEAENAAQFLAVANEEWPLAVYKATTTTNEAFTGGHPARVLLLESPELADELMTALEGQFPRLGRLRPAIAEGKSVRLRAIDDVEVDGVGEEEEEEAAPRFLVVDKLPENPEEALEIMGRHFGNMKSDGREEVMVAVATKKETTRERLVTVRKWLECAARGVGVKALLAKRSCWMGEGAGRPNVGRGDNGEKVVTFTGKSYAEAMGEMTANVPAPDRAKMIITKVSKSHGGEGVRVSYREVQPGAGGEWIEVVRNKTQGLQAVQRAPRTVAFIVRGLPEGTTRQQVARAMGVTTDGVNEPKCNKFGQWNAIVRLPADKAAAGRCGDVLIGWVRCRIQELDREVRCANCSAKGHGIAACKEAPKMQGARSCFKCGVAGHMAATCPGRRGDGMDTGAGRENTQVSIPGENNNNNDG